MDKELLEYFEGIEEVFCRHRGAPLLLSPLDFEKAVEWFSAGVAPETIERGIDAYFKKLAKRRFPSRSAICVSFAEGEIFKELEARRVAKIGKSAGLTDEEAVENRIALFISSRIQLLRNFGEDPEARAAMPLLHRFTEEVTGDLEAIGKDNERSPAKLEGRLAPLDQELGRLVVLESSRELVQAWKAEAEKRLGDLADAMEPRALKQTIGRLVRQAACSHWKLPRLSLLYME